MLEAGKLRHRIVISYKTEAQDTTTGEAVMTWSTLDTVWAAWEPYSVKDMISAASIQNQTSIRATIRYRSDVTEEMRVTFRSKTYEIKGPPLPDTNSGIEYLTLMLGEVLNA